jgi:hypothetical protein
MNLIKYYRRSNYVRRFSEIGGISRNRRGGGVNKKMASQEKTAGFVHLEKLTVGEALRLKSKLSVKRPIIGDTVYVYRVLEGVPLTSQDVREGGRVHCYDFTALVEDDDGELLEFPYDSRHFERVA